MASYPVDPDLTRPWTEVQTERQYEWTVNVLIPCLEEAGYTIVDIPSREVFIETWFTDTFAPYAQIPPGSLSNDEMADLNERCPQSPPSEELYG